MKNPNSTQGIVLITQPCILSTVGNKSLAAVLPVSGPFLVMFPQYSGKLMPSICTSCIMTLCCLSDKYHQKTDSPFFYALQITVKRLNEKLKKGKNGTGKSARSFHKGAFQ